MPVVNQLVSFVSGLHGVVLMTVVGLLVFLEAAAFVGLVVPGETALLIGGVLAAQGHTSFAVLLVVGCLAAVAGDSVGYSVGRWLGPAAQRSRAGRWVGDERWARAHGFVDRHGWWAVVLGRWVGVLRALVPAVVGMVRMPYRRFLPANAFGGITWVIVISSIGYAVGGSLARARSVAGTLTLIGIAAVVLLLVAVVVHRLTRSNRERGTVVTQERHDDGAPGPRRGPLDAVPSMSNHDGRPSARRASALGRGGEMEIDLGTEVRATDGPVGVVGDLVVDPARTTLTHLVVQPRRHHSAARLVPLDVVVLDPDVGGIVLTWSTERFHDAPLVSRQDFSVVESPAGPPPRGVPMAAWPYYTADALTAGVPSYVYGPGRGWVGDGRPRVVTTRIEALPAGTVEIRRSSEVVSSDDHVVGHVDGFVVAPDGGITHLVLARGHLWGRHDVTIPIGDVGHATWDRVHLTRTRAEVGRLPHEPIHRSAPTAHAGR